MPLKLAGDRKIFGVSELTRLIRNILETQVGAVWVEGEISNLRRPGSGHSYFTIKDDAAQLNAVLFRGDGSAVKFEVRDGMLVRAFGDITVYERSGRYQMVVRRMEEGGKGTLQARFEALKAKLAAEGLFDRERKKTIPLMPRHVGVVTSPTGAAIRDILNVIGRRFPNIHLLIAPVRVQGSGAAEEIAAAIDMLNEYGGLDVIIVGRGGGSIEDLWCFNEEIVARAIARSAIPVVSAVGHETDFTISDFVADLRVPTPSAAAELVVERKDTLEMTLRQAGRRLGGALEKRVLVLANRLARARGSYVFREPGNAVRRHRQTLGELKIRMSHELESGLREARQRMDDASMRIMHEMKIRCETRCRDLDRLTTQLRTLNPQAVLDRGYSITRDARGNIVRGLQGLKPNDRIHTRVAEGSLESKLISLSAS